MITEDPIDQAGKRGRFECVSAPEYGAAAKRRKASLSFSLILEKDNPVTSYTGVVDATPHYIGKAFCSKTLLLLALNCETDVTITRHHHRL
jgi:hypothetical protein